MPNSFSNKPGFYDEGDQPNSSNQNGSDSKNLNSSKTSPQDAKKKPTSNGNGDGAKRFVCD